MMKKNENGFTLIEVLIAMALAGLVMTGVYRVYTQQVAMNNTQTLVRDMQQNIRAAIYYMEQEIRMAGLDPSGNAQAGITVAEMSRIQIGADSQGGTPGDPNAFFDGALTGDEQVTYRLDNDSAENAGLGDGICDTLQANNTTPCNLIRVVGNDPDGAGDIIAQNIDALNFVYLGVDTTDPSCENDCYLPTPGASNTLDDIRSVQITVVARSGGATLPGLRVPLDENRVFYNQWPERAIILPANLTDDGYRRNLLTAEIRCRNMGL